VKSVIGFVVDQSEVSDRLCGGSEVSDRVCGGSE
jgi:hypothetical protein